MGEHQHPSGTYLAKTAVYDEICAIDEAALVTRQEYHGVCLLDGLAEATAREMNLTAEALGVIITEPVLQEGSTTNTVSE